MATREFRGYENPPRANHTPVRMAGGIGDMFLSLGPAEALNMQTRDVVIYTKWPEVARRFTHLPVKDEREVMDKGFDLIVHMNHFAIFQFAKNFSHFPTPELEHIYVRNQAFLSEEPWAYIAEYHPRLDWFIGRNAVNLNFKRHEMPYLSLGFPTAPLKIIQYSGNTEPYKKFITIHDGVDVTTKLEKGARAMKTWSIDSWKKLVSRIKLKYPNHLICQLGGEKSRPIPGVHFNFIGETFLKSMQFLANSNCHIDGDSGLVHVRTMLGKRSVVMFGPTPAEYFGHEGNLNLKPSFCGNCWWLKENWMVACPAGYEGPECLDSIPPDRVFTAVASILGRPGKGG